MTKTRFFGWILISLILSALLSMTGCAPPTGVSKRSDSIRPNRPEKRLETRVGSMSRADSGSTTTVAEPIEIDRGLLILNPTEGNHYCQGETLFVLRKITNATASSGDVTFSLIDASAEDPPPAVTVTVPFEGVTGVAIPLGTGNDIPVGTYVIRAANEASGAFGESDSLYIEADAANIAFIAPTAGEHVLSASTMQIRYKFSQRIEPGTVHFQLLHGGDEEQSIDREYLPGSAASDSNRREA